ncbi:MAG: hypothetical protein U0360_05090 [Dehalococcoidia bacterium]
MRFGILFAVLLLLVVLVLFLGLRAPTSLLGLRASPSAIARGGGRPSSAGGGEGGGGAAPGDRLPPPPSGTPSPTSTASPTPTPTATPSPAGGPYAVRQTESLGGERLSGDVICPGRAWQVSAVTPKVQFAFLFGPAREDSGTPGGSMGYRYDIPSAGESHTAEGSYTLGPASPDGVVTVSIRGQDHVAFKGFDGNFPFRYRFDLVPLAQGVCP